MKPNQTKPRTILRAIVMMALLVSSCAAVESYSHQTDNKKINTTISPEISFEQRIETPCPDGTKINPFQIKRIIERDTIRIFTDTQGGLNLSVKSAPDTIRVKDIQVKTEYKKELVYKTPAWAWKLISFLLLTVGVLGMIVYTKW